MFFLPPLSVLPTLINVVARAVTGFSQRIVGTGRDFNVLRHVGLPFLS